MLSSPQNPVLSSTSEGTVKGCLYTSFYYTQDSWVICLGKVPEETQFCRQTLDAGDIDCSPNMHSWSCQSLSACVQIENVTVNGRSQRNEGNVRRQTKAGWELTALQDCSKCIRADLGKMAQPRLWAQHCRGWGRKTAQFKVSLAYIERPIS